MNDTEKKLDALIDALGFDVERISNKTYGRIIKAGFYGSSAATKEEIEFFPATKDVKEAEYREVIRSNEYKLTKRDFDIASENYTDEMSRLHMVIRESNEYNREPYLANHELKKEIATLKTGLAFNEEV